MNDTTPELHDAPPPSSSRSAGDAGKYVAVAELLRANPGKWTLVASDMANTMATAIKKGVLRGFQPAGAFDAVARNFTRETKRADIWASYVGESDD